MSSQLNATATDDVFIKFAELSAQFDIYKEQTELRIQELEDKL
jgi:hypothetical protein